MSKPELELSRWSGPRRGIAARRWVIVSMGLRLLWQTKLAKVLTSIAWVAGIALALLGFVFTQLLAEGGWLAQLADQAGPRVAAAMEGLSALLLLYPDILIEGMFKALFWLHSYVGLGLSLIALAFIVPQLITRDRATQALTIYLARPLTSRDYLLGKLGIVVGVLLVLWTGPLLLGWILSIALAPDVLFLQYSLAALGDALLFNLIALVVLAATAFAVSSLAPNAATARAGWIGLWVIGGFLASNSLLPTWVRHASFTYDLKLVRDEVFDISHTFSSAAEILPLFNAELAGKLDRTSQFLGTDDVPGLVIALGIIVVAATLIFLRRLKAE